MAEGSREVADCDFLYRLPCLLLVHERLQPANICRRSIGEYSTKVPCESRGGRKASRSPLTGQRRRIFRIAGNSRQISLTFPFAGLVGWHPRLTCSADLTVLPGILDETRQEVRRVALLITNTMSKQL